MLKRRSQNKQRDFCEVAGSVDTSPVGVFKNVRPPRPSRLVLLLKLLGYDIRFGFAGNKSLFILTFVTFFILAFMFFNQVNNLLSHLSPVIISGEIVYIDPSLESPSFVDYLLSFFKGIEVYVPSLDRPFTLPVFWMALQVAVALLIVVYPSRDLYTYASQVITRAQSKWMWWISKCLWVVVTVLAFYAIGFAVAFVAGLISGGGIFERNVGIEYYLNGLNITNLKSSDFLFLFLLPVVVTLALSLLQMALSFIIKPVISFMALMSYHLISWVIFSPFLIADYSMIKRNGLFYSQGLTSELMLFVCVALTLVVILAGIPFFRRMSIYPK